MITDRYQLTCDQGETLAFSTLKDCYRQCLQFYGSSGKHWFEEEVCFILKDTQTGDISKQTMTYDMFGCIYETEEIYEEFALVFTDQ